MFSRTRSASIESAIFQILRAEQGTTGIWATGAEQKWQRKLDFADGQCGVGQLAQRAELRGSQRPIVWLIDRLRISAIVDAQISLIVDAVSA